LNRRLEAARESSPIQRRLETLNRDLIRVRKSMERLLTAYQEELLSLDELRVRMPPLRQTVHPDMCHDPVFCRRNLGCYLWILLPKSEGVIL
jgi:hypothetical protein